MENENVEFNEVRCKNLVLGDEETGFINLKVTKIDESPAIEINPNDGNEDSSITIGFEKGRPRLTLTSHDINKNRNTICLSFTDDGMPSIEIIGNHSNDLEFDSAIAMSLLDGLPLLGLLTKPTKDDEIKSIAVISITEKDQANLLISNNSIKGGFIALRVENDGGAIIINNKESTDENKSQEIGKGILLVNNSEMTAIDIKGQTIGGRNTQEKSSSEGESSE